MLRLVFIVCMIDAPDTCEQREMLIYESMPVSACVMGAMPELAVWTETHPDWRIARWRCEDDRTAQRGTTAADVRDQAIRVPPAAGRNATAPGAQSIAMSR